MNCLSIRALLLSLAFCVLVCGSTVSYGQGSLYTEGPGFNPPFEDIRNDITNGYAGTVIDVNNAAVEGGVFGGLGIQNNLKLHTLSTASINESTRDRWSRWYQVDGATQVFRLLPGEENVRNSRALAARIEAFDTNNGWNVDGGVFFEWVARYTIIKPINASICQVKDVDNEDWSMQLTMDTSGTVYVQHRRPINGQPKREVLVANAIGKPFDVRVRDNGLDYEVFLGDATEPFTSGRYVRNADPDDNTDTRFRWGIYVGAREVESEALIFVSHATVNPDLDSQTPTDPPAAMGNLIAGWDNFDSTSTPSVTTTMPGVTATAEVTGPGWSRNEGSGRGSSKDTTWGTFAGPPAADAGTTAVGANLTLVNGAASGDLTFTITNGGSADLNLNSFHMDALAFRPNAARTYALNVLSGDLTIGNVFTSGAPASNNSTSAVTHLSGGLQTDDSQPETHDQHDDIEIDLSGLEDHTLAAGESAVIQIAFSNGTGSGSGHHLFIDNVAFSVAAEETTVLLGDVSLDGVVNFLDIAPFIGVLSGSEFQIEADCDLSGGVDFLDIASFIAILSGF
jgi:hypothetical protein